MKLRANTALVRTSLLVALALVGSVRTSVAAQDGSTLSSDGFVRLVPEGHDHGLVNSWIERVQGTKGAEGECNYRIEFWADAGDMTPQMAYAVAMNPATCVVEVMRGTPPAGPLAPDGGTSESDEEAVDGETQSGDVSIAASGTRLVTFTTWWEDPYHVDVNKTRNAVRIEYSGSTITSGYCKAYRAWLSDTGWHKEYSDSSCVRTSTPATHGSQYVLYHNSTFCGGGDTYARYNRNNAYATPWGTSGWIDETAAYGACSSLLHSHQKYEPDVYY